MQRTASVLVLSGVLVAALAGCAGVSMDSGAQPPSVPSAPVPVVDADSFAQEAGGTPTQSTLEQQIIVTGSVSIIVESPAEAADAAADLAASVGGTASSRGESAGTDYSPESAWVTLRIPADRVDEVLDDLRDTGDVVTLDMSEQDVTMQMQDLEVRIQTLRTSVERLQALLASAADTATLLEVEAQLTSRTAELESLLQQQSYLADQVALSTISVTFQTEQVVGSAGPSNFWEALAAGWHGFVAFLGGLLISIGLAWPWLLLLALLVVLVVWLVRRSGRRAPRSAARPGTSGDVPNPATVSAPAAAEAQPASDVSS